MGQGRWLSQTCVPPAMICARGGPRGAAEPPPNKHSCLLRAPGLMRTSVRMVVCTHLPRFELVVAAGGPRALSGRALVIAPSPGGEGRVGEVSGAAEARGVCAGMALGEALARCPDLGLVPADPLGVARVWERAVCALEGIGAAPEPARPGLAYFRAEGLHGLHGGERGVLAATRGALGPRARMGVGPTRFCALAAALEVRSRRAVVVRAAEVRRYLATRPVGVLRFREETAALVEPLERLGVRTLGELAALGRNAVADRFGAPGTLARRLALGRGHPAAGAPARGAPGGVAGARPVGVGAGARAGAGTARGPAPCAPTAAGADPAGGSPLRAARRAGDLARAGRLSRSAV